MHFLFVVMGPLCAFAVVRTAGRTSSRGRGGHGADDTILRTEADRILALSAMEKRHRVRVTMETTLRTSAVLMDLKLGDQAHDGKDGGMAPEVVIGRGRS